MKCSKFVILLAITISNAAAAQQLRDRENENNRVIIREDETVNSKVIGIRAVILDRLSKGGPVNGIRLHLRENGSVRSASGFKSRAYDGSAREAATVFLSEYRELLGNPISVDCVFRSIHTLEENSYVRFVQVVDEVPILGADVIVHVNAMNVVEGLTANYDSIHKWKGVWRLNGKEAIAAALTSYPMTVDGSIASEKLLLAKGESLNPIWRVVIPSNHPKGDWEFLIAAETGETVSLQDLIQGQAQGYAFPSNPVKGTLTQVQLDNLLAGSSVLTGSNAKVYSYYRNFVGLIGPNVIDQLATSSTGNFLFKVDDPRFAEVQLYYGMDRVSARFRNLGFKGFGRPLEGTVLFKDFNAADGIFLGQKNAYFSSASFGGRGGLFFYLTPRGGDVSLDSDVIFHEYTHAVVTGLVGSVQSPVFRALNEGTADYFSSSFLDDPDLGEYAAKLFGSRLPFLRTTDNPNTFPVNLAGEVHIDGNIWSGALWDVRKRLGADRADRIALNALARMIGTSEFYDAGFAAYASANSLYGSAVANQVADIMAARGLNTDDALTSAEAITLSSGGSANGRVSAAAPATILLGVQQFRIDVPNQATALRVQVVASSNVRFYIRYRAAVGFQNGRFVYEQLSQTDGTNISGDLTLNNVPELQKGTYYVAVANLTTQAVNYTVTVTVIGGSTGAGPATTVLSSSVSASGSAPFGPFLASRQYTIDVPSSATSLSVSLRGDQDVDLYVSYGKPVTLNNQGYPDSDFVVETTSPNETLVLTSRTLPQALKPGRYYVAVYNFSGATAKYSVSATIGGTALPPTQIQALSPETSASVDSPSFDGNGRVGNLVLNQFSINIPANATSWRITADTTLDVDVLIRRGSAVSADSGVQYFFSPTRDAPSYEINSNSNPPLATGTYYLAFANYSPGGGRVSLRYSLVTPQTGGGQISGAGVVNAASFIGGAISAGEIVTIFGSGIGPNSLIGVQLDSSGRIASSLSDTRVLFDDIPAPLIYVSTGQISAIVPYSVSGKSNVSLRVEYQGKSSNAVSLAVAGSAPAFFTANSSGTGQGAFLNQNSSVNSASNPADQGSVVVLYATGEGQTTPGGLDGRLANEVYPKPQLPVSVQIGGVEGEVLYAGAAPGLVAGVFQVNVKIPSGIVAGPSVPIRLGVGGTFSRSGVTLAIR